MQRIHSKKTVGVRVYESTSDFKYHIFDKIVNLFCSVNKGGLVFTED